MVGLFGGENTTTGIVSSATVLKGESWDIFVGKNLKLSEMVVRYSGVRLLVVK